MSDLLIECASQLMHPCARTAPSLLEIWGRLDFAMLGSLPHSVFIPGTAADNRLGAGLWDAAWLLLAARNRGAIDRLRRARMTQVLGRPLVDTALKKARLAELPARLRATWRPTR
jgi:hypothetical protein